MMNECIGFIGLGSMGAPMVRNLLRAGYVVRVYDSNPAQYPPLQALGAQPVALPWQVCEPGGIAISMVSDDDALCSLMQSGLPERLGPGGIHLSCSTISPHMAEQATATYALAGATFVAATVLGRPDRAEAGQLMIFMPEISPQEIVRLFTIVHGVLGSVYKIGKETTDANKLKLACNAYLAGEMYLLAHLISFVQAEGLDPAQFVEILSKFIAGGSVLPVYGPPIVRQEFREQSGGGFNAVLGEKDIRYFVEEARRLDVPLGPFEHIHQLLQQAREQNRDASWAVFTQAILRKHGQQDTMSFAKGSTGGTPPLVK